MSNSLPSLYTEVLETQGKSAQNDAIDNDKKKKPAKKNEAIKEVCNKQSVTKAIAISQT